MRRSLSMALLACAVLLPSAALAARELGEFKSPQEMTPEELEASKRRSGVPIHGYKDHVSDKVTPIPWKTIGLFTVIILLATPYALRYYRATAGEVAPARRRSSNQPPSERARERAAYEETKVRGTGPVIEGNTRVPVRRNTRP